MVVISLASKATNMKLRLIYSLSLPLLFAKDTLASENSKKIASLQTQKVTLNSGLKRRVSHLVSGLCYTVGGAAAIAVGPLYIKLQTDLLAGCPFIGRNLVCNLVKRSDSVLQQSVSIGVCCCLPLFVCCASCKVGCLCCWHAKDHFSKAILNEDQLDDIIKKKQ